MRPEDLLEFLRRRPFEPFRIFATDGRTFDVNHPDQAIVLRSRVVLASGGDSVVPDHLEHLALVHVVRIEELGSGSQRRAG
jgi:hypothetical protein